MVLTKNGTIIKTLELNQMLFDELSFDKLPFNKLWFNVGFLNKRNFKKSSVK